MEFWVVAAATGAGYVAKHWQNLSGEKDACQLFNKMPNSGFPLPKLAKRCLLNEDEEKRNNIGRDLQDNTDEINGKHEFRTQNRNRNAFSNLRPLVVTGNNRDCQRKQTKRVDVKDHKIGLIEENRELYEPTGSVKLPRRPEQKYVKKFETRDRHSQENDMVSLFLGVTIGILSTIVTNQRETEHLNELLEQAEYMVQDLHNKLEIKEGFTTKEYGASSDSPKADNFELTSDIEAELEAELERLEENMKDGTLQRLSNVVESYLADGFRL